MNETELTGPASYGRYYWCIKTDLSKSGEIYVYADQAEVSADGTLVFLSDRSGLATLVVAPGQWKAFFAASVMDGHAVAVESWEGEVVR